MNNKTVYTLVTITDYGYFDLKVFKTEEDARNKFIKSFNEYITENGISKDRIKEFDKYNHNYDECIKELYYDDNGYVLSVSEREVL